jgi:3-hydroxyisobutyrate dehydrogenase-like beta-hydroxyacid dehydrogenase
VARELSRSGEGEGVRLRRRAGLGRQPRAINGALTVMCGGDAAAFDAARPVAMAFAKAMTLLGPSGSEPARQDETTRSRSPPG